MEVTEMIVGVAGGIAAAYAVAWLLLEILVRAFASYASSVDPRAAELLAQLTFFVFERGLPRPRGPEPA